MGERREWLVTDQHGAFAMGTLKGVRTRRQQGFFLGISGRTEATFLASLDVELEGKRVWPISRDDQFSFELIETGPRWAWRRHGGVFTFEVFKNEPSGISLVWSWSGSRDVSFRLRPLFAMRALNELDGNFWCVQSLGDGLFRIDGQSGLDLPENRVFCRWSKPMSWHEEPAWFRNFFYQNENGHGYADQENLFSAGYFEGCLGAGASLSWTQALKCEDLPVRMPDQKKVKKVSDTFLQRSDYPYPALDFVLDDPAGIVAGFPWFGEIGRDTFVALPGIVCARLAAGENPAKVRSWAYELLDRWGSWIAQTGMLPHTIEPGGSHDWSSADGTLWFCHALAALWVLSLDQSDHRPEELFPDFEERFAPVLRQAIASISEGRHLFLRLNEAGLLEVTEAHATWMDSRVGGAAVVPRLGVLPEINALWFQARFLNFLWSGEEQLYDLERLGSQVLHIRESDRPNEVFLHSLPLAPSFILKDWETLRADLKNLKARFNTPVGLRSLAPDHPAYRGNLGSTPAERKIASHQGAAWAWLKGHLEMAENRATQEASSEPALALVPDAQPEGPAEGPIEGHIPAVFAGDPPYEPGDIPAQASALACSIENTARKSRGLDTKLSQMLTRLWIKDIKRA